MLSYLPGAVLPNAKVSNDPLRSLYCPHWAVGTCVDPTHLGITGGGRYLFHVPFWHTVDWMDPSYWTTVLKNTSLTGRYLISGGEGNGGGDLPPRCSCVLAVTATHPPPAER